MPTLAHEPSHHIVEEAVHVAGVGDVGLREAAPGRLVSRSVHVGYVHQGPVLPEGVGHGPPDA